MKDKIPPKITPSPNRGEIKINPIKPARTATKPIVHKIRRCEIGGGCCSVVTLSKSSLIAKHKFYKGTGKKAKGELVLSPSFVSETIEISDRQNEGQRTNLLLEDLRSHSEKLEKADCRAQDDSADDAPRRTAQKQIGEPADDQHKND